MQIKYNKYVRMSHTQYHLTNWRPFYLFVFRLHIYLYLRVCVCVCVYLGACACMFLLPLEVFKNDN